MDADNYFAPGGGTNEIPSDLGQTAFAGDSTAPLTQREEMFFRWAEDTTLDLFLFGLYLDGKQYAGYDKQGKKQTISRGTPLLDANGIHFTLTSLLPICNKNTQLSELSEEKIRAMAMDSELTFEEALARKLDCGEIKTGNKDGSISIANYQTVVTAFCNFVESSLWRSHKGGERKFISKSPIQNFMPPQPDNSGIFGSGLFRNR